MNVPNKIEFPLIHLPETPSTNSYLSGICRANKTEEFTTVLTDFQTAGRGQRGSSWEAERGTNLLFSYVLYPEFLEARRQFLISQITALAVKEELDTYTEGISIKWPNDIYWKDKKICGMLIENDLNGMYISRSIAGIGININQETFRGEAPNPISLFGITGTKRELLPLLTNIMQRIERYYEQLKMNDTTAVTEKYMKALFRRGEMHRYRDAAGEFTGEITGVDPDGILRLRDENGNEKQGYAFKEIQYIL